MSEPTPAQIRTGLRAPSTEGAPGGWRWALGLLPLVGVAGLLVVDVPMCPLKTLFGIPCPGCGMTRAARALLELDFAEAVILHPLIPLIAPLVIWFLVRTALVHAGVLTRTQFDPARILPRGFWMVFALLFFGTWLGRLATGWHPDPVGLRHGAVAVLFEAPSSHQP